MPNQNGPLRNGRLTNLVLGIVGTVLIAVAGVGITTWADTKTNTQSVKECKNKLDSHCKKQETLDGDIRVINEKIVAIDKKLDNQGRVLDAILEKVK